MCYNKNMTMKGSYTCIFGGGAVRGLAYIGAIKALQQFGFNVKTFVGSSVGSIVAALLAVGYCADEIYEILQKVNFELFRDIHFGFNKNFALSKGNVFAEWIREAIEKKYYGVDYKKGDNESVKFKDLKKNLIILTTDLNTFSSVEFSNFETPDFEVASAVRISCSMPGLMTPVEYGDSQLVDGDLLKGIPLWKLSKNIHDPQTRILEFRLEGENVRKDGNTFDFLNSIYSCITSASTDFIIDVFGENDKYDYIKITTGDIIVIDFNMSLEIRRKLVEMGYNDTLRYLTTTCVRKKHKIANIYRVIIELMSKLLYSIKHNNVSNSVECLKNLFLYMSDFYKYIDFDIYESILTLKNDIFSAKKIKTFFSGEKFSNKESILNPAEIIYKVLLEKYNEIIDYIEAAS